MKLSNLREILVMHNTLPFVCLTRFNFTWKFYTIWKKFENILRLRRPRLKEGGIVRVRPFRGYNSAQATLWLSARFLINSPSPTFSIFLAFILCSYLIYLIISLVHQLIYLIYYLIYLIHLVFLLYSNGFRSGQNRYPTKNRLIFVCSPVGSVLEHGQAGSSRSYFSQVSEKSQSDTRVT